MSEQVLARMRGMVVGSLRYYAEQCECDGECEQAEMLTGIADRIAVVVIIVKSPFFLWGISP